MTKVILDETKLSTLATIGPTSQRVCVELHYLVISKQPFDVKQSINSNESNSTYVERVMTGRIASLQPYRLYI
jgi:hypothetical protein